MRLFINKSKPLAARPQRSYHISLSKRTHLGKYYKARGLRATESRQRARVKTKRRARSIEKHFITNTHTRTSGNVSISAYIYIYSLFCPSRDLPRAEKNIRFNILPLSGGFAGGCTQPPSCQPKRTRGCAECISSRSRCYFPTGFVSFSWFARARACV